MTRLCGCATCAEAAEAAHGEVKRLLASGHCEIYIAGIGMTMMGLAMLHLVGRGTSEAEAQEIIERTGKDIQNELSSAPGKYRTSGT